jgi:hypothetical protein
MNPLENVAVTLLRATLVAASASVALGLHAQAPRSGALGDERIEIALATTPQLQTLERYLQSNTLRATNLLGRQLQDRGGQALGEISDIAVRDGAPSRGMSLVVNLRDTANVSATRAVLPLAEVQISADGSQIYADASRTVAAGEPSVPIAPPPAANAAATPTRTAVDRSPAAGAPPTGSLAMEKAAGADRFVASLIGAEVLGGDGRPAAVIDDLLVSTAGIDTLRVILKVGGAGGNGEKRIALPFEQLELTPGSRGDEPVARVGMSLQSLQRQPAFVYDLRTPAR